MRRREFMSLLGGAAAASPLWPLAARAQQGERVRRVGVLIATAEADPETALRVKALAQGLKDAGWVEARNLRLDYRFGAGDLERMRDAAAEVAGLAPDAIVVHSNDFLAALRQIDRATPTVFTQVGDPVGSGFVANLAHPGGNLTGFTTFEPEIGGKWLQLLKEVAPSTVRALVLLDPKIAANQAFLRSAEAASAALGMTVSAAAADHEADRAIATFASGPHGGLLVLPNPTAAVRREQVAALAARHHLPSIYAFRFFVVSGGLTSYGVDTADLYRRAASYVDRILRGAKPGDLPVQAPTKYELVINLKTAKTLGLEVPPTLLARADEVIE